MAITYQDIKNYICSMENFWTKEEAKRLLFTKIPIFMQHYSNHLRNSHMYVTKASVRYRGIHKPRRKAKGVLRKSTLWRNQNWNDQMMIYCTTSKIMKNSKFISARYTTETLPSYHVHMVHGSHLLWNQV